MRQFLLFSFQQYFLHHFDVFQLDLVPRTKDFWIHLRKQEGMRAILYLLGAWIGFDFHSNSKCTAACSILLYALWESATQKSSILVTKGSNGFISPLDVSPACSYSSLETISGVGGELSSAAYETLLLLGNTGLLPSVKHAALLKKSKWTYPVGQHTLVGGGAQMAVSFVFPASF